MKLKRVCHIKVQLPIGHKPAHGCRYRNMNAAELYWKVATRVVQGNTLKSETFEHRPVTGIALFFVPHPEQGESAPVAQLDRVPASEAGCHRFESCRARQIIKVRTFMCGLFLFAQQETHEAITLCAGNCRSASQARWSSCRGIAPARRSYSQ